MNKTTPLTEILVLKLRLKANKKAKSIMPELTLIGIFMFIFFLSIFVLGVSLTVILGKILNIAPLKVEAVKIDNFINQQWELIEHSVKEFLTVLSFVDKHVYIKLFLVWFYTNIFAFIVCGFISALVRESTLLKYGIVKGFIKSFLWTFYNIPGFTSRELMAMYSVAISDPGIDILIEEKPFKAIEIWDVYTDLITGHVSSFTTLFIYITSALSLFIPAMRPFAKGWKEAYIFLGKMISRKLEIENRN